MSIVELMVGITIGLFILAGASLVLTTQLGDNRRLLLEAQIQQDMRVAADLIARDIRRAGYWAAAWQQVWPETASALASNPYREISTSGEYRYRRSTDDDGDNVGYDDGGIDLQAGRPRELVGFRHNTNEQTIDFLIGDNWQALTDPAVLRITQFTMNISNDDLPLPCGVQCPTGTGGCVLVQRIRNVTVTIVAQAVHDSTLQRSLRDNIRLRNDLLACP